MELSQIEHDAATLISQGWPDQAEAFVRPFLASGSGPISIWALLAQSLRHQGRAQEALPIQELLVAAQPGNMSFRFDLAEILLLLGQYERGWREYHWRYSMSHTTRIARKVQRPRWDGSPIPGKTLLIHDEQGYGDTLQFLRLVELAKQRSQAEIVLEVTAPLRSLAERSQGFDHIVTRGELPRGFDCYCEMMSLPMVLGLDDSQLPGQAPYLSADPARVNHWRERLAGVPRPLVALAWAGRPMIYNGQNRAVTLAALAPLALEGVTFLSVQKGPPAEQAKTPPNGMKLVDLGPEIESFEDTAAIFALADLVISIDSAPAHLAGALGRPVWTLLGHVADWRWQESREDSLWYPTMRLFRQPARGDWDSVIGRLASALPDFLKTRHLVA